MLTNDINKQLQEYVEFPNDSMSNFRLAYAYEIHGHQSAAFSFYLRAAEMSTTDILAYECLLRMAICISSIGNRVYSLKGIILRAISIDPTRPEGYSMMAKVCEQNKDWHEAYTYSRIGEEMINRGLPKMDSLISDVGYTGDYVFTFQRAVSSWWIGLYDESVYLFRELSKRNEIRSDYKKSIENNIRNLGYHWKKEIRYNNSRLNELRIKFPGAEIIEKNYSQCFQDMFILTMLMGKRGGRFLEIGCGDPFISNNTVILEQLFGWTGISIDIDAEKIKRFKEERISEAIAADAMFVDYEKILSGDYDYLQLDCEPAMNTFKVLTRIPLHKHRFAVVTFEHDAYSDENPYIKEHSREYLRSYGYEMVVNNISEDRYSDFEDWWVCPELVSRRVIDRMRCISENPKRADLYMYGKI